MSIEAMKKGLEALDMACAKYGDVGNIHTDWGKWDAAGTALRQAIEQAALAKPDQEPVACGYDETVGMCTSNPCCEQEPVSHLWECIGRWSSYLAVNGTEANLAPPNWLLDAVIAATSPPRKEWVGLTELEIKHYNSRLSGSGVAQEIEAKLKEKNGG
jgi:hypothetical protein